MINAPDYDKIFASLVLSPTMGLWSPQNKKRIVCNKKLSLTAKGFNLPYGIIDLAYSIHFRLSCVTISPEPGII